MWGANHTPSITERLEAYLYALALSAIVVGFATGLLVAHACGWGGEPK